MSDEAAESVRLKTRIAELERLLDEQRVKLTGKLAAANMRGDEYQAEVHRLNELKSLMTSAASKAAATATLALERGGPIVEAAIKWRESIDAGSELFIKSCAELRRAVDVEIKRRKGAS